MVTMKLAFICFITFLIFIPEGIAQVIINDGLYFNRAGRQVWVTKVEDDQLDRALLWKVSKDSVFILPTSEKTITLNNSSPQPIRFHYSELERLITLKNKPGITGMWSGALIGFISGVIINSATYPEVESTWVILDEGDLGLLSGLLGAVVGAGGGAAVASFAKKNWEINGNKNKYDDIILDLDKRAYWNRSTRPKSGTIPNPENK